MEKNELVESISKMLESSKLDRRMAAFLVTNNLDLLGVDGLEKILVYLHQKRRGTQPKEWQAVYNGLKHFYNERANNRNK